MIVEQTNREYYDALYSSRRSFYFYIHSFISFDQQSKTRRNLKELRPYLKQKMFFLDYGFGFGTLLLRLGKDSNLYGSDISEQAIQNMGRIAAWKKINLTLFTPDEFEDAVRGISFDLICSSHVLEHVPDDFALTKLFHRYLRPSGILLVNLPIHETYNEPKHARKYTLQSACDLLSRSGFEVIKVLESDRWTAFLSEQEQLRSHGKPVLFLFRILRLFLALLPLRLAVATEIILPKKYLYQQLLITARKVS